MTMNEQIKDTITNVEEWLKKFSFLWVRYENWAICSISDRQMPDWLSYSVSFDAGSTGNANAVTAYFIKKGMKEDITPDSGPYVFLYKLKMV
jgi:hypothetical protein